MIFFERLHTRQFCMFQKLRKCMRISLLQTVPCIMSLASCSSLLNRLLKDVCFQSWSLTESATGKGTSATSLASDCAVLGSASTGLVLIESPDGARASCIDLSKETARARQSTCEAGARDEDGWALPSTYTHRDQKRKRQKRKGSSMRAHRDWSQSRERPAPQTWDSRASARRSSRADDCSNEKV